MASLKNLTINDTGSVQIATGNTAQRVSVNGDLRFNSTTNKAEQYVNGVWRTLDGSVGASSGTTIATGGSISTAGGYRIHTFTDSGTFSAPYTGRVEVLVIGGGGGGAPIGGGAGAGGYVYGSSVPVAGAANYTVVRGGGGTGGFHHYSDEGTPGNPSSFSGPTVSITATGGGKGGQYSAGSPIPAMSGGSGGGGPGGNGTPGTTYTGYPGEHPGGLGQIGQGHPGGYGHHGTGPGTTQGNGNSNHAGGAGGGSGGRGRSRYTNQVVCFGGEGTTNAITGSAVIYTAGGGGGTHVNNTYGHGPSPGGAQDGSGNAGTHGGAVATAGGTNRGGGGGGGAHPGGENPAGAGGPGVVVVRYRV
jgi:hypothetical protein